MLLALTWPMALVSVAGIFAAMMIFFMVFGLPIMTRAPQQIVTNVNAKKTAQMAEDIAAMRADVAALREAVAELDRQFKSVG